MVRVAIVLLLVLPQAGCYYMQAAAGQWEVLRKREPVEDVIADEGTPAGTRDKLQLLREARDFSITELSLPDNKSYRSYVDLQRDYVLWSVFAVRELSFDAKRWCFPVAGCVNYRGHFVKERAVREAARLQDDGYDVLVGGIAAYSTLGNFSDPILSTMLGWDDAHLVGVLFHELAHQVVYVRGDTAFNESFATAVEEFGVKRWLQTRNESDQFDQYLRRRDYRQAQFDAIRAARNDLESVFDAAISDDEKRQRKAVRLASLSESLNAIAQRFDVSANWRPDSLNNANLMSISLYEGNVEFFRKLFARCNEEFDCFYAAAAERAARDPERRLDWP